MTSSRDVTGRDSNGIETPTKKYIPHTRTRHFVTVRFIYIYIYTEGGMHG